MLSKRERYLVFDARRLSAQGAGNLMHGLLAAQLLGFEYKRTVCLEYPSFMAFFTYMDPLTTERCPDAMGQPARNILHVTNYEHQPHDECQIDALLRSDIPIVHFVGNTYPSLWPTLLPPNVQFSRCYRPRHQVLHNNPSADTVVHLRVPDDPKVDGRPGLDLASLKGLAHALDYNNNNSTIYMVTNQVSLYQYFAECCGWSHPPWKRVQHSSLPLQWSHNGTEKTIRRRNPSYQHQDSEMQQQQQERQLWSDWYALVTAKTVYHTRSDFSSSAVHWSQNQRSFVVTGVTATGRMQTVPEAWVMLGGNETPVPPLSERRRPLRNCHGHNPRQHSKELLSGLEFSRRRPNRLWDLLFG